MLEFYCFDDCSSLCPEAAMIAPCSFDGLGFRHKVTPNKRESKCFRVVFCEKGKGGAEEEEGKR